MLKSAPMPVLAVLAFFILVTPLVVLHEFGHFLVARLCGVKVDRFSVGFGRAIASWKTRSGMEWRLGWIPLGGYVKFAGDATAASAVPNSEDLAELKREIAAAEGPGAYKRYFHFKPVWQRALIVAAGPFTNFVLAIGLFAILFSAIGIVIAPARVQQVIPGTPAASAGFKAQDLIVQIGDDNIESADEAVQDIRLRSGTATGFVVIRDGRRVELTATPQRVRTVGGGLQPSQYGRLGLQIGGDAHPVRYAPVKAMREGVRQSWRLLDLTVTYVGRNRDRQGERRRNRRAAGYGGRFGRGCETGGRRGPGQTGGAIALRRRQPATVGRVPVRKRGFSQSSAHPHPGRRAFAVLRLRSRCA